MVSVALVRERYVVLTSLLSCRVVHIARILVAANERNFSIGIDNIISKAPFLITFFLLLLTAQVFDVVGTGALMLALFGSL